MGKQNSGGGSDSGLPTNRKEHAQRHSKATRASMVPWGALPSANTRCSSGENRRSAVRLKGTVGAAWFILILISALLFPAISGTEEPGHHGQRRYASKFYEVRKRVESVHTRRHVVRGANDLRTQLRR